MKEGKGFWLLNQDRFPFFFFYLLILFLPTQLGKHFFPTFSFVYGLRIDYLSPTLYLTDIFIILIFLFSVRRMLKTLLTGFKKQLFLFFVFAGTLLIGVVVSKNPSAGYLGVLKLLEFIYLGAFVFLNFKKFNKNIIVVLLSFGIILESTLAVLQYFNQGSMQGVFYFLGERSFTGQTPGIANASINGSLVLRPYATFPHPNVLGGFLAVVMIFVLSLKSKIHKYFLSLVLIFATTGILISLSRTAILAWIVLAILFFGLAMVEKYKKAKINPGIIRSVLVVLAIILFYMIFVNSIFVQRFKSLILFDQSITQREKLITQSLIMIKQNPIFGVGVNNFINNLRPDFNTPLLLQPVHNIFLLVFSQTGIIGIGLFIYLFLKIFFNLILTKKRDIYLYGIISTIIFIGLFDHYFLTIQQGQILLTICLSYCLFKARESARI